MHNYVEIRLVGQILSRGITVLEVIGRALLASEL